MLEPETTLHSLFIVGSGVLSFTRPGSEGEIELRRIGPSDHFGEIGMLTGAPATATLSALVPASVYELANEEPLTDFAGATGGQPRVVPRIGAASKPQVNWWPQDKLVEEVPANRLPVGFRSGRIGYTASRAPNERPPSRSVLILPVGGTVANVRIPSGATNPGQRSGSRELRCAVRASAGV